MRPETHYARSGEINIAYQVVGDGPRDLVLVPGWVSNIRFEDRGTHALKGVPGEWHLFAVGKDTQP
ncbi:MAG: hypothetical protein HYU25_13970 [Candidatus Rokubacteria bacterium]|nr:hypothetical protein [Candidatus Rokubacteria bacterium]